MNHLNGLLPMNDMPLFVQPVDATLAERSSTYGDFGGQAEVTQGLKETLQRSKNWALLADDMKEALDMIVSKIARILNGDPTYIDSWHDIIGYARLIEKRLQKGDTKSE